MLLLVTPLFPLLPITKFLFCLAFIIIFYYLLIDLSFKAALHNILDKHMAGKHFIICVQARES